MPTQGERIAVLEANARNAAAQHEAIIGVMKEIRDDVKSLRAYVEAEVTELRDRQVKVEGRVDKVFGNVRAFVAGMAAAFTLLGTAVGAGITSLLEWLK